MIYNDEDEDSIKIILRVILLIHFYCHVLGYPVVNDPLYNHDVFGPSKGKGGDIGGKTDEHLVRDLINIHNAENWLGIDGDSELSMFNKSIGSDLEDSLSGTNKGKLLVYELVMNF